MINEKIRQKIVDAGYENTPLYDNPSFDNSILGINSDGRAVYDYELMVEEFANENYDISINSKPIKIDEAFTESREFIDYNTLRATPYEPLGPIVLVYSPEEEKYYNAVNMEDYDLQSMDFKIQEVIERY